VKAAIEFPAPGVAVQDACVPADEADRLPSLHRLGLLDTAPSEDFDAVTRVAAAVLRAVGKILATQLRNSSDMAARLRALSVIPPTTG
jgi:hypothetical protein